MRRLKIAATPEFREAVRQYQQARGFRSWAAALLHLAAIGLRVETGQEPPTPARPWGGSRRKGKLPHEREGQGE
jgi:hypothetical protein